MRGRAAVARKTTLATPVQQKEVIVRCRRKCLVGLAALLLVSLGAVHAQEAMPFDACIDALRRERAKAQPPVRAETFEKFTRDVQDLRPTIRAAGESQPEFKLPIWDYIARLADAQRVADGRQVMAKQAEPLRTIAARHGVDAATVVAVFGVETDYGRVEGKHRVVDATSSRACLDLQNKERLRHFFAALWLLQEGLVEPDNFRGSWAGAFGLTQFMPGTFIAYMDDGDGSGRPDIVGSAPDALATTARYIASLGWTNALRWGVEVALPAGAARAWIANEREHGCLTGAEGGGKCRTLEQWAALGVAAESREGLPALPKGTRAALIAPAGERGPAWLVTRNYQAIWQYNRADAYALAIGLLADALRGDPPLRAAWPTDDAGISRADFRALQGDLVRAGHADVSADGFDGPRTRDAIRAEETARGWLATGRAGARIARALREAATGGASPAPAASGPDSAPRAP